MMLCKPSIQKRIKAILNKILKTEAIKERTEEFNYIKIRNFYSPKGISKKLLKVGNIYNHTTLHKSIKNKELLPINKNISTPKGKKGKKI